MFNLIILDPPTAEFSALYPERKANVHEKSTGTYIGSIEQRFPVSAVYFQPCCHVWTEEFCLEIAAAIAETKRTEKHGTENERGHTA